MSKQCTIANSTKTKLNTTISVDWLLCDSTDSTPVAATVEPLINGKNAFGRIHEKIAAATTSIDIAIWGFQPSMYFKRDGKSPCIGDLLIEKALQGVEVRVLVWSMWWHVQTVTEDAANMGGHPGAFKKSVNGVSKKQIEYDRLWFRALEGGLSPTSSTGGILGLNAGVALSAFYAKEYPLLAKFSKSPNRKKLQYKTRSVAGQKNNYLDTNLPFEAELILKASSSHHQKTVLIDYEKPERAVGFVMEHNMLDNYWDESIHKTGTVDGAHGKNSNPPLQDVSSMVTGEALWYINKNFCQSWDRVSSDKLTEKRKSIGLDKFPVQQGKGVMAQILRTYDKPDIEDIKKVYLKNIKRTTSYIYTENQYFRWPPLADAFIATWKNLRAKGRPENLPIHWFVVTNSSDLGMGKGTYNTNEMFKKLGRQDVMPNVAYKVDSELKASERTTLQSKIGRFSEYPGSSDADRQKTQQNIKNWQKQRTDLAKQIEEQEKTIKQLDLKPYTKEAEEARQENEAILRLKKELGVKVHVCTLTASDKWQEVYVHSKVTIIDDVFTFIGSANINTRSMQDDTELGIITEHGATARKLRRDLWQLHTKDGQANPEAMHNPKVAAAAFDKWGDLMQRNKNRIILGQPPQQPLCEFLRLDPKVTRFD